MKLLKNICKAVAAVTIAAYPEYNIGRSPLDPFDEDKETKSRKERGKNEKKKEGG